MNRRLLLPVIALATSLSAQTPATKSEPNWLTGDGVSLGGVLFPHFHFHSAIGDSTADPAELAVGHHDPDREGITVQNLEMGASARLGHYFEAFTTYAAKIDFSDDWAGEFEEWFGKIKNIPGGLEVRGGRYYNRFGLHNTYHPHGFDWADQYLVNARFLGDDGLRTIGGEVTWTLPVSWTSVLTTSVGAAPQLEEHAHDGAAEEHEFEADGAAFNDVLVATNWTNQFDHDDFHQFRAGLSGAWGENVWGRTTQIYGAHAEYQWRENGYERGGRWFRWRTEAMLRSVGAISGHLPGEEEHHDEAEGAEHEEAAHSATLHEFGIYTDVRYGWPSNVEVGLRGEYVSGIRRAGLDERYRVSPGVTYYLNSARTIMLRVQYNYDHSNDFGDEHSVWGQFGFNWGGAEVR